MAIANTFGRAKYIARMRTRNRCPKCDHDEILYVPDPKDVDYDAMAIGGRRGSMWTIQPNGGLEAFVCMSCGYTELYVKAPAQIDITKIEGAQILKAGNPQGPFR